MGDFRLFRINGGSVTELDRRTAAVEKSLQTQIEQHMDDLLGVRFLATEYYTGDKHRGRIDSLGLDENGAPVIVEYKRSVNQNVINQGLFYLDWLLDHKGEFTLLVQDKLGQDIAKDIEWKATRLICIAGDFSRYDEHAVQQINRSIELIRYGHYGDDLLALELVNLITADGGDKPMAATTVDDTTSSDVADPYFTQTITHRLTQMSPEMKDLYDAIKAFLMGLGDDVQFKELRFYHAFKRIKNFVCIEAFPQAAKLGVFVKVDPASIDLEAGFTRDVSKIGHFGTGDLEITITSMDDLKKAEHLLIQSYENS
ncbi:MAG: DUF91 domain-containing protein [SAR324 cluster bacterium]|nr:DUF91 domain-containing protein [SAR324 cluster bacterium]